MKLKKLNKKQKDLLKKSLLKGLNITCYVVTGLTLLLGTIIGLKSCSSNNKQSVATTPVVTDVLNEKRSIDGIYPTIPETYANINKLYDYAETFLGGREISFNTWYDGFEVDSLFETFPARQVVAGAVYHRNSENALLCHLNATIDMTDEQSSPDITRIDKDLSYIYVSAWSLTYPIIELGFTDNTDFVLDVGYVVNQSYGSIEMTFTFPDDYPDLFNKGFNNSVDIVGYNNDVTTNLSNFFNYFNAIWSPRYRVDYNQDINLVGYIYPYHVYGTAYNYGVMKYGTYGLGDTLLIAEPWASSGRSPSQFIKLFSGSFVCDGVTYSDIIAQYSTYRVRSNVEPLGVEYILLNRIYYRTNTGATTDVVIVHNNLKSYYTQNLTDSIVGQGVTWNFTSSVYRNIHINYGYLNYSKANFLADTDPLQGLYRVFSNSGNGANTLPDGYNDGGNVPVYDDVPTSYAFGSVFGLISMAFGALSNFLQVQVLPGLSLGTLFFIPLVVMIIIFIVWLVKR